ncbi:MAG: toll/interleukin-1 receptor domain-containing protein [Muribaculaceae bacterium]|nr:toll/interleukin-1 receptor domain-containing protein [Muribaculaceae bacterium]
MSSYKYFAFISYSSADTKEGRRLQRRLENFRLPAALGGKRRSYPMRKVFFAPTEIQPGVLTTELQTRLEQSRYLIVVCSPASARSRWVSMEIEYFASLGRADRIYLFIVGGQPGSGGADECFNPALSTIGLPELLGVNIHEKVHRLPWLNRERAYTQLISKLLCLDFDALWQRQRRRLRRRRAAFAAAVGGAIALAALTWAANRPFATTVLPVDADSAASLPEAQYVAISLLLDEETKTDTASATGQALRFANLPRSYSGRTVAVRADAPGYLPLDTTLTLTPERIKLPLRRDPAIYGHIRITVVDFDSGEVLPHKPVVLAGTTVLTDAAGVLEADIPLSRQATAYTVTIDGHNYTLHTPCGPDDYLSVR